jgi:hypothetical protein
MKRGTHTQTHHGASKEACKDEDISATGTRVSRSNNSVNVGCTSEEDYGAEEVRPDVDRLIVHVEERTERMGVGVLGLTIAREDKGIVATPVGEVVPQKEQRVLDL